MLMFSTLRPVRRIGVATISFQFNRLATRQDQNTVLNGIRGLPGVRAAIFVDPDTSHAEIARMCMAEAQDEDSAMAVRTFLSGSKWVESSEAEPERHLVR